MLKYMNKIQCTKYNSNNNTNTNNNNNIIY